MNPSPQEGGAKTPTPQEAKDILNRFVASHFRDGREHARFRIPADPTHDDDLRMLAFIDNAEMTRAALTASLEREKKLRGALEAFVNLWERRGWDMTMPEVARARALLSTQGGPTT